MASIDAFLELAERQPVSKSTLRLSLRRLDSIRDASNDPADKRQRQLILIAVGLVHVLLFLILSAAMRVQLFPPRARSLPMLITFIQRPRAPAVVKPLAESKALPAAHPITLPTSTPTATRVRNSVPHPDALQAVIPTPKPVTAEPVTPEPAHAPASFYDATGALRIPSAEVAATPRNLMEHRSVSFMLPGGAQGRGSHFRLKPDVSPQTIVNKYGGFVGALISNAIVHPRPDLNGNVLVAADRGLRGRDRDADPCEDIALDTMDLDLNDSKERDQADQRQQDHCVGH